MKPGISNVVISSILSLGLLLVMQTSTLSCVLLSTLVKS
jgi:hypothetical protein